VFGRKLLFISGGGHDGSTQDFMTPPKQGGYTYVPTLLLSRSMPCLKRNPCWHSDRGIRPTDHSCSSQERAPWMAACKA
jgi:hypothetical protein